FAPPSAVGGQTRETFVTEPTPSAPLPSGVFMNLSEPPGPYTVKENPLRGATGPTGDTGTSGGGVTGETGPAAAAMASRSRRPTRRPTGSDRGRGRRHAGDRDGHEPPRHRSRHGGGDALNDY